MIGVCVVYLASTPGQHALMRLSIAQIARHTASEHRIYGVVPDGNPETVAILEAHGAVVLPAPDQRIKPESSEHAFHLDRLVRHAISDGCGEIVTFDMDSWPILDSWDKLCRALHSAESPLVAIVRTEIGDNFPSAAFAYFPADFWDLETSTFGAEALDGLDARTRALLSRENETGAGLFAQLKLRGWSMHVFERSNVWSPHTVIGGVYANTVFHLGAMSRKPRFLSDVRDYALDGDPLKRDFAKSTNNAIRAFVTRAVLEDHDGLMQRLTGAVGPLPARRVEPSEFAGLGRPLLSEKVPVARSRPRRWIWPGRR